MTKETVDMLALYVLEIFGFFIYTFIAMVSWEFLKDDTNENRVRIIAGTILAAQVMIFIIGFIAWRNGLPSGYAR